MAETRPPRFATHEVANQPPPLEPLDLFATDRPLREAVAREGAAWAAGEIGRFGALLGSENGYRWGREANEHPPRLRTHDRFGGRLDEVEFHPAWHEILRAAMAHELHNQP